MLQRSEPHRRLSDIAFPWLRLNILLAVLCAGLVPLIACREAIKYVSIQSEDTVFPRSSELLQAPALKELSYHQLIEVEGKVMEVGTLQETWADQRFVENSTITLRYKYQFDPAVSQNRRVYRPVNLGLDMRQPLSADHRLVAAAFLKVIGQKWNVATDAISAALDRREQDIVAFDFENAVGEVSGKDLRQRGNFVSIDFYDKEYYHRQMQQDHVGTANH